MLNEIDGISCVEQGRFVPVPKIDMAKFNIHDDEQFMLDLLVQEKVLMVQGSGFNWPKKPTILEWCFYLMLNN